MVKILRRRRAISSIAVPRSPSKPVMNGVSGRRSRNHKEDRQNHGRTGSESLWDSRIIPKGIGSIPSGIGARTFLSARLLSATERTVPRAGNPQAELRASFGLRPSDFGLRQSQRDCVLQPRVAESARLPWVGVRAIFNPTRFSPGSSRLATLGLGAESLWDSLIIPQGMGSIPSRIGRGGPRSCRWLVPGPAARSRNRGGAPPFFRSLHGFVLAHGGFSFARAQFL